VNISAALVADLNALAAILDHAGTDFEVLLRGLADDARRAVPSFLGLTMSLTIEDYPVTFTVMDDFDSAAHIATSALLPLTTLKDTDAASVIVFYAGNAGAFVDFAADASFALGLEPDVVILDRHLTPPNSASGLTGLDSLSDLNQALGILIDRGHTVDTAHSELHRMAGLGQITVLIAARQLIESISLRHRTE
jgi:hypothetical protein